MILGHFWKIKLRFLKFCRPILNIKRHQKNTQAKILEKITSWQHALITIFDVKRQQQQLQVIHRVLKNSSISSTYRFAEVFAIDRLVFFTEQRWKQSKSKNLCWCCISIFICIICKLVYVHILYFNIPVFLFIVNVNISKFLICYNFICVCKGGRIVPSSISLSTSGAFAMDQLCWRRPWRRGSGDNGDAFRS